MSHVSAVYEKKLNPQGVGLHPETCGFFIDMGRTTRKTLAEFVDISNTAHKGKFDYSKSVYTSNKAKIEIICPTHGSFWQMAQDHMRGVGCPTCYGNHKCSTEEFIRKARLVHGDKYDYSLVEYKSALSKVKIICPIHGLFLMKPNAHLCLVKKRGTAQGCPTCGKESNKVGLREFIKRAKESHGDLYDYSMVVYKNCYTKIAIICKKHGVFYQTPDSHTRNGHGCPLCSTPKGEARIIQTLLNLDIEFEFQKNFHAPKPYNRIRFDFYLPSFKTIIEFNGRQHYEPIPFFGRNRTFERQQEVDLRKKVFAKEYGLTLLTIPYWEFDSIEQILAEMIVPAAR